MPPVDLDARREDLLVELRPSRSHRCCASTRPPPSWPTTSPRLARQRQLADDRRRRVADQRHLREVRPDVGDPARQRAARHDHRVAQRDPVVRRPCRVTIEPARLERLAPDHPGRDRLVVEAALELEQRRQRFVLPRVLPRAARSRSRAARSRRAGPRSRSAGRSISPIAVATPATASATSRARPGPAGSANDSPRCTSSTVGFAENAISSRVTAIRIANTIPRRRVGRLARTVVMAGSSG